MLLHISDIHFRSPDCDNPDLDPDRPFRTRLVQDVRGRVTTLARKIRAILVGGDIAFKGDPKEYCAAFEWFKELACACECPLEKVFVIPGNHDVDRGVINTLPGVRNVQQAILRADTVGRERELRAQFNNPETGRSLFAPLAAYNEFAKLFNCQVYGPDRLYWKQFLPLESGVRLCIYGLTSTLLSGSGGIEDTRSSLYLSPLQTVLDPVDDVVNLVLCHHPPDWFMDQDEVQDAICERAAIHLFGHKHRQRHTQSGNYIRFNAAAVNPDRNENGWCPGYNLIDLRVSGEGKARFLEVEAHMLEWQSSPELFRPTMTKEGKDVVFHRIAIPGPAKSGATLDSRSSAAAESESVRGIRVDKEAVMSEDRTRSLVFRFWNLTVSQRRDIVLELGLINKEEMSIPEPERYGRAFQRARDRELLDRLAEKIELLERQ